MKYMIMEKNVITLEKILTNTRPHYKFNPIKGVSYPIYNSQKTPALVKPNG